MKSLSILILLGTLTALVIGVFFAVRPASAEITQIDEPAQPAAAEPVTPLTGEVAAETVVLEASNETDAPAEIAAAAFAANLEKDTAGALVAQEAEVESAASFESFAASVSNGNANQITGVYVQDVLAFGVTGQNGNAAFVSNDPSVVTQFGMAAEYGSTAFLAHNYLAGAAFFNLSEGNVVTLVYGDGSTAEFQIQSIRRFQALSPDSTQSSFVDLDSDQKLSASDLFYSMYNGDNSLVLQTCIANEGISTWGRMFVIAVPLS
jgi:hypothetical protein